MTERVLDKSTADVDTRYRMLINEGADPNEWAFAWRTEINRGGFKANDFMMKQVVEPGKCIGCASCVSICPVDVFDYVNETPIDTRADACVYCILCAEVCPVLRPTDNDLPEILNFKEPPAGETHEPSSYGEYSYGLYARSTDPDVLAKCQDGGVVSTMIIHGLDTGTLKGAVTGDVYPDNRQIGRHKLARTRDDVLGCAASRYTYAPNTLALQQAMRANIGPLAVVGVPCQVDGVRLQQNSSIRMDMSNWYRDNISLVFGLFCSESFTHESIEKLGEILEIDPKRIDNINIKGKVVVRVDGEEEIRSVSLKKYREFARPACLYCLDYGAENADIGCGGIGLDGWTYTLIRTERGHEAFQAAFDAGLLETRPLSDEPRGEFLMDKLSADKKKNRPLPAQMPNLAERVALDCLCPKTFYLTGPGAPQIDEKPDEGEAKT
ncbi:MAG: 4Fe-4S binding protein [Rhodospirillales bacterium]|jgi:coenzyme F420 hydrogenase subunit beta|nr:4Fe-4S binding protein [Rhodospirillales bacterium]MBT4039340.1 4Fe-4S binding protein [Rhodospirillales bacterium]MBT4626258.1 4Fe-4S binding protein [Rhodospirillales bacterium]MBT5353073.1 4Fe-4S binding protein [Rhodospirillales bacterium]MBT5520760.1 4Fe-4S binding protein [Rhodospirillales bacterium]